MNKAVLTRSALIIALLIVSTLPSVTARAQDAPGDTTRWETSLVAKLAGSQVAFDNWQGGGTNSFAITTGLDGKAIRKAGRFKQTYVLRLALGGISQNKEKLRKAEDEILLSATYQFLGDGFFQTFNPTLAASFRSQVLQGYNYGGDDPAPRVSALLAPAYLTQSLGLTFDPAPWIKQRVGLATKETVVRIKGLRPLYGVDMDKSARIEAGLEAVTEVDRMLAENVQYKSTLALFAAFNQADSPDVLWENAIIMKVNSWLNVNLGFVMLYDRDVLKDVQVKEVLSVGTSIVLR